MKTPSDSSVTVDSLKLSYLAGVIDSDGCIAISKYGDTGGNRSPRYVIDVTVVNTSLRLMNWLVENFGGFYSERKRVSPNHKRTYSWKYTNSKAVTLLTLIEPYLVEKWDRASNAINFYDESKFRRNGNNRTDPEEIARRESHYQIAKLLNQTGPVQPQRLNSEAPAGSRDDAIV